MGREVVCLVRFNGRAAEGKALRETSELVFRSPEFRLKIPFAEMASVAARDGELVVGWPEGEARFELGEREAGRWLEAILHPPSLLAKLGVKDGQRVSLLNVGDAAFRAELAEAVGELSDGQPAPESDLILFGVEAPAELAQLEELKRYLTPSGAVWVVFPKGRKELRDVDVIEAGRAAGFVDVKVAAFSRTHTANRLVPRRS